MDYELETNLQPFTVWFANGFRDCLVHFIKAGTGYMAGDFSYLRLVNCEKCLRKIFPSWVSCQRSQYGMDDERAYPAVF